jgi:amino acid adenylation domain-containing protein
MKNVEDIYPLTPLQSGMLFHSLMEPESGIYVSQFTCSLPLDLDVRLFRQACERLVGRHGVLRTAFFWDGLAEPVQVVRKSCALPWQELDWRGLSAEEQQRRFEDLRYRDRHTPLSLDKAPLLRFSLTRFDRELGFAWTFHHLLFDGWSLPLLIQELASVYAALQDGREPALPPVRPFSDYVVWLRKQDLSRVEPFWRKELEGFTAPNALSIIAPVGTAEPSDHAEHRVQLSREVTASLQDLAVRHRLTLQTVTLGAWALLLGRYSGEEDVVFGGVVSGRPAALPGVETMVGMFINTLPVRVQVNGAEPLAPWLLHLQKRQLTQQEFAHSPLSEIQRWSEVPNGSPLFETLYAFENYPTAAAGGSDGLRAGNLRSLESTNYPISLALHTANDQISLKLAYDCARVDEAAALRQLGHLGTLLAGMAEGLERRIGEVSLLTTAEALQLTSWNATARDYPQACIHELFAEQAEHSPDRVAVASGGRKITYGEIHCWSSRLAHRLRRLGVGPGSRLGLCAESLPERVIGMLGILAAGGAYVPLNPTYPQEWLAFLLEDMDASVLISEESLAGRLPIRAGLRVELLSFGTGAEKDVCPGGPQPASVSVPDDPAYVMYTSGSTGRPKGVVVPHRAVVRLVRGTDYVQLGPADRVAQASNSSFDAATFEVWGALLNGGLLVGIERETLLAPDRLTEALHREGISVLFVTTALFNQIARETPGGLASLRCLLFGGELVDPTAVCTVLRDGPPARLLHVYGPTETTTFATWHRVESVLPGETVPIGRPLANGTLYVLAAGLIPQPAGVPGELYLGGAGLAHGYHGRPELTAERFVPDPFGSVPGGRLYRTGDLVRQRLDGPVEFLRRLDNQVKIRGFRIEPGEIEATLLALPGVREAAVAVRKDTPGGRRLVAYVVGDTTAQELRQSLRERLPDYMVPAAFVALEALPLNPNGKVDRKALPAPEPQSSAAMYVAPQTPVEESLAGIWAEVLGRERIGVTDSFLDLGGHSLLATQVMSRLRTTFGIEMPLRDLFTAPRLADLAIRVEAALRAGTPQIATPLVPVPREGSLPLSFAQQRLWFIDQLEPGSPLYNLHVALRVEGPLDSGVLSLTLGEIVRRHEALRTVFAAVEGSPAQVIQPAEPFALPVFDLSGLPEREREATALSLAGEEAGRPFDLARGPLLRAVLLRLAESDHVAVLTMHHIASDGWSMGILVREVATLYAATTRGEPSPLPELRVQYADFAVWQHSWLQGELLEQEIGWWRQQLAGLPPLLELPTDRPRPAVQSYRGATRPVRLPAGLTRQLGAFARREGATLFMVLLAGFQALLARYSGQDDLAVGSPIAGRNRAEIEGLIGFFVNTLVMRGDLAGEPSFRDLLGRVRETALAAYLHQDVPFEKLVEELAPERRLAQAPLFQVMLSLQNAPVESLEIRDLRLRPVDVETTTAKFDLELSCEEHGGELVGVVEYATDLFDAATIDRLIGHHEMLLTATLEGPERTLTELPLLSSAERHQLLAEWNDTAVQPVEKGLLPDLFAARVASAPDRVAATCEGETLTYAELDARADRLARHLWGLGCGPESRVGVALERSLDVLVAFLGVLKAGAVYVPLDPEYPRERLVFLLEDSRPAALLTQESLRDRLPIPAGLPVLFPAALPEAAGADGPAACATLSGDRLAYVIYTSGSTGRPKGAMVTHDGMLNHLWAKVADLGLEQHSRVAQTASLCFDISVWQLLAPLLSGGSVHIAGESTVHDPDLLLRFTQREGITVLEVVPSLLAGMLDPLAAAGGTIDLSCLQGLIVTGEACAPDLSRRWLELAPHTLLLNAYGPTECSDDVTHYRMTRPDCGPSLSLPIGRPVANTRIYVLDPRRRPVPRGVAGELSVAGRGVGRGYLGQPARTAEVFVPDPLSGEPGARLYRTGDLARWLADGTLEFLGRLDHQVKVRGFRIELGEIEAALVALAGVREAVVVVWEDRSAGGPGDPRLVAYVTGDSTVAALREGLRSRLPDYMVPAVFVTLEALPLTPNGKVDRRALPAPGAADRAEPALSAALLSPVEELLADLWRRVLKVDRVGRHDDFFALGGHSLLATQLLSRIRETFQVDLPLRSLFEETTLEGLARRIASARRQGEDVEIPPLVPVPRGEAPPLSFAQERLWFLDQLEPGRATYNIPSALRVSGDFVPVLFDLALSAVVRRQEALRTTFASVGGRPVQVVQPPVHRSTPLVDLSALPEAQREAAAREQASCEAQLPFDLAADPLLRVRLLRLEAREHVILLTLHHIVSDGWSTPILVREIGEHYAAFAAGRPAGLPELPVQYADFAAWQRLYLQGEVLEREIGWWRRKLSGAPEVLELPADRPRPAVRTYAGALWESRLPADLSRALADLGRREGVTLFMILLACFQTLLHRLTSQLDIVVGTDVASRNRTEIEGVVGFFVNHLVLRTGFSDRPTFREVLRRVREACLEAYDHQDLPFVTLVSALRPKRSLSHMPLFQVLFVLQNMPRADFELPGLTFRESELEWQVARFDLALFAIEDPEDGLVLLWSYGRELFDEATIERLSTQLTRLIASVVQSPDARVGTLEVLTARERKQQIMNVKQLQESRISGLRSGRRRAVDPSLVEPVQLSSLGEGSMPLVIRPADGDVDLLEWAAGRREELEGHLHRHGAILFRGFGLRSVSQFEALARAICPDLYGEYGDLPREAEGEKVYHSTPYPPDKTILFHNESSHMARWPMKQWFFCVKAAEAGGETPIVDCRRIYGRLDPSSAALFESRGLLYQRNFTEGLDVSWQDFFRTSDRAAVEARCRQAGMELEWTAQGLRTRQRCPAVLTHPRTGEKSFFNQIQLHHVSCLEPEVRESLLSFFSPEDLPRNVFFGDGSPIPSSLVQDILGLYWEEAVSFPWQEGDVLMVDNMLTAHARNPYKGARKIVVAMGELSQSRQEVA